MNTIKYLSGLVIISLALFIAQSAFVVGEGDGFNWGDGGDGFNWGDDGDGFNWGDNGDGFDWGDGGGGDFGGSNDPPPGSGGDSGSGNPSPFGGNDPIAPQQNQPASWNGLSDRSVSKNSVDGTVVYANVGAQCDDPDDPEFVTLVSSHNNYELFMDGNDLKIRTLKRNHVGTETVTLDCNGVRASFSLTISTTPNTAPVFESVVNRTINEGELVEFTVRANDPDRDSLTHAATNLPQGASYNTSDLKFSWKPGFTQAGTYDVRFTADDSFGGVSSLTLKIVVLNSNGAPILNSVGDRTGSENNQLSFTLSGSDPDGDAVQFSATNLPSGAGFTGSTFTWTPSFTQAGSYSVTFFITDTFGASDSETITLTITNTNRGPVITSTPITTTNLGREYRYDVDATDADSDSLTFSLTTAPFGMTINSATGLVTWFPMGSQLGDNSVDVRVSDGSSSATQQFTVRVLQPNSAPELQFIGDRRVSEHQLLEFTVNAFDQDGDTLFFSATNLPSGAAIQPFSGLFQWRPNETQAGNYSVTFTVDDGFGGVDMETITITVVDVVIGVEPKPKTPEMGIMFNRIRPSAEFVQPGEIIEFHIDVENDEDIEIEDMSITASVWDWGVARTVGPFDLDPGDRVSRTIIIDVPEDAELGDVDVRFTASSDDVRHIVHRVVTLVE